MKSAAAIAFDYRPSRSLAMAIVVVTLLAIGAVAVSGVPFWFKLPLVGVACAYGAYATRAFVRVTTRRAAWYDAGHWRLADTQGAEQLAELQRGLVRENWIVLRLRRSDGQRVAIILGPDNSDAELRRKLRVRLARGEQGGAALV